MNLLNAHILEPKRDDEKTKKRIMVTAGVGEERDLLLEADSPKVKAVLAESIHLR